MHNRSMLLANLVKIEKQTYHYIETVPKYDKKVIETEVKSITLTHIYMTAHFLDLTKARVAQCVRKLKGPGGSMS